MRFKNSPFWSYFGDPLKFRCFETRGIQRQGSQVTSHKQPTGPLTRFSSNSHLELKYEIPSRLGHHLISGKSTTPNHTSIKLACFPTTMIADRRDIWFLIKSGESSGRLVACVPCLCIPPCFKLGLPFKPNPPPASASTSDFILPLLCT